MVAVPAVKPVTNPVVALTMAMLVSLLDQLPPLTVELKVVVLFAQTSCVPLRVPAVGTAVTVTERVAVALAQPPVPVTVYVMVAFPAATPVTRPVEVSMVATAGALLVHLPPETVDVKAVVSETQTV